MTNRLPLPTATIKEIMKLINKNSSLYITNPLRNIGRDIVNYDYADAVKGLTFLQKDFPELMNYKKHTTAIQKAEKRYNNI